MNTVCLVKYGFYISVFLQGWYRRGNRMKLIDVIEKLSKGEIKHGTLLTVKARNNRQYKYIRNCFLDAYNFPLNIYGE